LRSRSAVLPTHHTCINSGLNRVVRQGEITSVRWWVAASRSGITSGRYGQTSGFVEILRMTGIGTTPSLLYTIERWSPHLDSGE